MVYASILTDVLSDEMDISSIASGKYNIRRGLDNWVQNKSTLVENSGSVATVYAKL